MKKIFFVFLIFIFIVILLFSNLNFHKREQYSYNPEKAIEYSYRYIEARNPDFPPFENNCTTYVSQCLFAGGLEMDGDNVTFLEKTKVVSTSRKWFSYVHDNDPYQPLAYYVSSSFTKDSDFVEYWKNCADIHTSSIENNQENFDNLLNYAKVGDVIFLHGDTIHSALIVKKDEKDIYYNGNSNNRYEYPLSNVDRSIYKTITYMNFVK